MSPNLSLGGYYGVEIMGSEVVAKLVKDGHDRTGKRQLTMEYNGNRYKVYESDFVGEVTGSYCEGRKDS